MTPRGSGTLPGAQDGPLKPGTGSDGSLLSTARTPRHAAPCFTSLDPLETKSQGAVRTLSTRSVRRVSCSITFRHSGWQRDRRRVLAALQALHPNTSRLDRFKECGSNAWVMVDDEDPGRFRIVADLCHDRFCRPCARARGATIAANLRTYLGKRPFRFVTLTIRTDGLSLKDALDKLYRSFARLRRSSLWTSRVDGGCAICEIKRGRDAQRWHPHLHLILEGRYLPQAELKKHWLRITRDSFVVDVRMGRSTDEAAGYVTKYVSKPFDQAVVESPDSLREAMHALHGRRLVLTFGTWRGWRLLDTPSPTGWSPVASLEDLLVRAESGEAYARHVLQTLTGAESWEPSERSPPSEW